MDERQIRGGTGAWLEQVLRAPYEPPYGTPLGPADVRVEETTGTDAGADPGRSGRRCALTALGGDGQEHEHAALVDTEGVGHPTVDGREAPGDVVTPVFGERVPRDSPDFLPFWFDQVLRQDAEARRSAGAGPTAGETRAWEGEGVDAALERAERGIVAYADERASTEEIRASGTVPEWLREQAPGLTVGWDVFRFDARAYLRDDSGEWVILQEYSCRNASDPEAVRVRYLQKLFDPTQRAPEVFQLTDGRFHTAFIGARTDGARVTAFDADGVLSRDFLGPYLAPWDGEEHETGAQKSPQDEPWLAVGFPGTPMLLLIPPGPSALRVYTDDDGALTVVELSDLEDTRAAQLREERFQRRWGRFLNQDVALSGPELAEAVRALHERLDRQREALETGGDKEGESR